MSTNGRPAPDRRQLPWISDQHEPLNVRECVEECRKLALSEHRALVHDHRSEVAAARCASIGKVRTCLPVVPPVSIEELGQSPARTALACLLLKADSGLARAREQDDSLGCDLRKRTQHAQQSGLARACWTDQYCKPRTEDLFECGGFLRARPFLDFAFLRVLREGLVEPAIHKCAPVTVGCVQFPTLQPSHLAPNDLATLDQPPYCSMTSSISFIRRIVSERETTTRW